MTETLNEKALEAAYDLPWALEEFTRNGQRCANIVSSDGTIVCEIQGILDSCGNRENGELIVSAVNGLGARSSLPAGDYAGLTERMRYVVGNPSAWDAFDDDKSELIREAATAIAAQDAKLAWLWEEREGALSVIEVCEDSIETLERKVQFWQARAEAAEAQVKAMDEALGEAREVVDAAAGDNRPARAWAIVVRDNIDSARRALAVKGEENG